MALYDRLMTSAQLGGGLQTYSSNGWPYTTQDSDDLAPVETRWDGYPGFTFPAWSLVDACVHNGELHVVWVEPQWNGSDRVMRGPFVRKWNGGSWVSLGGEVEPSLAAVSLTWPFTRSNWETTNVTDAIGQKSAPSRPRIVSDGTNLFVAYLVREVEVAPEYPAVGSWVYGTALAARTSGTDYQRWSPRKLYLRKWNAGGGTWDLYGHIPAISNNVCSTSDAGFGFGSYILPGRVSEIGLDAVPDGSGVVYAAFWEVGSRGSAIVYVGPPVTSSVLLGTHCGDWTYKGVKSALHFGKFDGGDVNGVVKEIRPVATADGVFNQCTVASLTAFTAARNPIGAAVYASPDPGVGAQTGTGYVFWYDLSSPDGSTVVAEGRSTRWDDLLNMSSINDVLDGGVVTYDPHVQGNFGKQYYLNGAIFGNGTGYATTPDIVGAGFVYIDSSEFTSVQPFDGGGGFAVAAGLAVDGTQNVWGVSTWRLSFGSPEYSLMLYHRTCAAWEFHGFAGGEDATIEGVGWPRIVVIDDALYTVGAYRSASSTGTDVSIRAYRFPICRLCLACGADGDGAVGVTLEGAFRVS